MPSVRSEQPDQPERRPERRRKYPLDDRPMKGDVVGEIPEPGKMNALGLSIRRSTLDPLHMPYRASALSNSITLYNPLDWVRLITLYARNQGARYTEISLREGDQEAGPEIAFTVREPSGRESIRIRVSEDGAKMLRQYGARAIRLQHDAFVWDAAAKVDVASLDAAMRTLLDPEAEAKALAGD